MSGYCPTCGGYLWSSSNHRCPPKWECRIDDKHKHDSDWREIYAHDAETAAEKFAEEYDADSEYGILQQGDRCEQIVEVRTTAGEIETTRWNIRAESLPHYYAEEAAEVA